MGSLLIAICVPLALGLMFMVVDDTFHPNKNN